jgi:uncharacterized RDD family membrane protein YckC
MICENCQQDLPEYEFPHPGSIVCSGCLKAGREIPADAVPVTNLTTVHVFWRRLLAIVVDGLILGLVGNALGFLAFDYFAGIGPWARLIGFGIALVYFGILDSSISSGQTPGKRLLKVRVVDAKGRPVSAGRAVVRYVVIAVPFFLNNLPVPITGPSVPVLVGGLLIFGLGGSIVYLLVFNRRTRQGVHDLITGTYVVNADGADPVSVQSVWRGHVAVPAVLLIGITIFFSFTYVLMERPLFKSLLAIQKAVLANQDIRNASVESNTRLASDPGSAYLLVAVEVRHRPDDFQAHAEDIARMIVDRFPDEIQTGTLQVSVQYGYDMGIAHASMHVTSSWSGPEIRTLKMQGGEVQSL